VQLHGGMGVTDEFGVSHYFKRLVAFEMRFGSTDTHLERYAQQL
jgi:alkylation response protein AidB-like acyl-CoA dehydrogenase